MYSYDPVGHKERHTYRAGGSSVALLQPLLDSQVGKKNMEKKALMKGADGPITLEEAVDLVHSLFVSAAEREIHTGDGVCFKILTKGGNVEERRLALRKD